MPLPLRLQPFLLRQALPEPPEGAVRLVLLEESRAAVAQPALGAAQRAALQGPLVFLVVVA